LAGSAWIVGIAGGIACGSGDPSESEKKRPLHVFVGLNANLWLAPRAGCISALARQVMPTGRLILSARPAPAGWSSE
jgi:hypothetical protein